MQHHDAQSTVESLLQAHRVAIDQVIVLGRSAPGRYWIHRQSCDALVSTYKQALLKLTHMLIQPLLSQHLNGEQLQLLVQPGLDMVLAAIHQGTRFLENCRPSVADSARSYSVRHRWVASLSSSSSSLSHTLSSADGDQDAFPSNEYAITDDKFWLLRALLQGCATDATETHLHDFLVAFSVVGATIEGLNAPHGMFGRSADQAPLPDLFWKDQNNPRVLLVSGQQLDHVKHHDDAALNAQLEITMSPDYVGATQKDMITITTVADDGAQLAAFVKEKIRCAKQSIHESIDPIFLDMKCVEVVRSISASSVHTSVHEVMCLGRKFALKVYKKDMEEVFLQEAKIHIRLHHPNVLHAVGLCKGQKEYGMLMELMEESLKCFLHRHAFRLRLQEKVGIMLQIAKGMAYVHERGVIHRDLKPSNVLVRSSMDTQASRMQQLEVKITDFGESNWARSPDSSSFGTKRVGTSVYRAPEVLNDNKHSSSYTPSYRRSADVYSFAMTCFELLAEKEPFDDSERRQQLWDRVIRGERPDLGSMSDAACPPYLKHCLDTWWAEDPRTRHSFAHICCILRHLYACLARCGQMDRQPNMAVQFPFVAWPFWRWKYAQGLAQQRLREFETRRESEDWKERGHGCESTRVNDIPYELHVMQWAIKKAAVMSPHNSMSRRESHVRKYTGREGDVRKSGAGIREPVRKSFGAKLKEFCCIKPSKHEAFYRGLGPPAYIATWK